MRTFEIFQGLHQGPAPLLIGNVWDVTSARVFEQNGFKAIATSSSALANTFGYSDGENLPFELLLTMAKQIVQSVQIPFSVDIEAGYSRTADGIVQHIERLHAAGVAGVNIEDTLPGDTRSLQTLDDFQKVLSAVANHLSRNGVQVFINVRTDGFLLGMETALAETLARIKAFESAGAHGIFVPCITQEKDIAAVVAATKLPINVMAMPNLPSFDALAKLGVKRISMGTAVHKFLYSKLSKTIQDIQKSGSFKDLF